MKKFLILSAVIGLTLTSCGGKEETNQPLNKEIPPLTVEKEPAVEVDAMSNKGIGPVKSVEIPDTIDEKMVAKGKEIFESKCTACHKLTQKFIGPAPKGLLDRRTPEWVMNMILNPEEMIQKDPIAKKLLAEANGAPMANQNLTEQEAREVLEYIRTIE